MTAEQPQNARPGSAIPEAALELLVTQGFDATSVDELAAAAGISRSTFFRRFGSKEEMVFADQEAVLARVGEALAAGHATPSESVVAAALAVFDHHTARPHASRLRYGLLQAVPALRDRELVSTHRYEAMFRTWLATAEASATSGHVDAGASRAAARGTESAEARVKAGAAARPAGREREPRIGGTVPHLGLGTEAAAVAFAAGVVAVHNAFLRRWLRSPEPTVRRELETELHALRRLFTPSLAPPSAEATQSIGAQRSGATGDSGASGAAHTGDPESGSVPEPPLSPRVVVAVADAPANTDAILAAVREALDHRGS